MTDAAGSWRCNLVAGVSAPFVIVVTDPNGGADPMVSVATRMPPPGETLIVNVTPLTTAIVAQLSADDSPFTVVANPAQIDTSRLQQIKEKVLAQLDGVMKAVGVDPDYDPFSSPIEAGTSQAAGNTADRILDLLKFSTVNGVTMVATVADPSNGVALADADTATSALLPTPAAEALTLADALRSFAPALRGCFALEPSVRVQTVDDTLPATAGGPEVTAVDLACRGIFHPGYKHNGYRAGQIHRDLFRDASMTNAQFFPPVLVAFLPGTSRADGMDRAILNLRYVDGRGVAGSILTVARREPGSATSNARGSDWWLHGNQQPVDTVVRAWSSRRESVNPDGSTSGGEFHTGFDIFINKDGPGSTGLRAARVKGPGLPPAGLVLTRPDPKLNVSQSWLNLRNKTGRIEPDIATPDPVGNGNLFRLQRTTGLSGTAATQIQPNLGATTGDANAEPIWAHPLDYGRAVGSTDFVDFKTLKAMAAYTIELFYDDEVTPRHTVEKQLITPVQPATTFHLQPAVDLLPSARRYLSRTDALAAAQDHMDLAWTSNPLAPTISSAGVYTFGVTEGISGSVSNGLVPVARGATSTVAAAPVINGATVAFPPLETGGSHRTIQLRYRMLDGSFRDAYWGSN